MFDQISYTAIILILAAAAIIVGLLIRPKPPKSAPDPDELTPYAVYTYDYDIVDRASAVIENLSKNSPDARKGFLKVDPIAWAADIARAEQIYQSQSSARTAFCDAITALGSDFFPNDCAVTLLIDQSGSMRGAPVVHTAATVRSLSECLQLYGVTHEVVGFTTAGWHGGFAREQWVRDKRPAYPGRLCALLHIIYKSTEDASIARADWEAMLHPDLLRENVDGEALQWAYSRLQTLPQNRKILIILSDGAPVDDSTLMENGLSILWQHLEHTIAALKDEDNLQLAGFGIGHSVDGLYPITSRCAHIADLLPKLSSLLVQLLSEGKAEAPPHA